MNEERDEQGQDWDLAYDAMKDEFIMEFVDALHEVVEKSDGNVSKDVLRDVLVDSEKHFRFMRGERFWDAAYDVAWDEAFRRFDERWIMVLELAQEQGANR